MAARGSVESDRNGDLLTTPTAEGILAYHFADPALLRQALTHRSAVSSGRSRQHSNERLEFVGDRVLGLVIAEWLAARYPEEPEGALGPRLARLVSQPVLAMVAEQIGLGSALSVSPGEAKAGVKKRATVLADALEAAIGAVYLDGGLEPARAFIRRAWQSQIEAQFAPPKDAKSTVQEWALKQGEALPIYQVVSCSGPPHAPEFRVVVRAGGRMGEGSAGSKRAAEMAAAEDLLKGLK